MDKLEQLLSIDDDTCRSAALLDYARSLNVDVARTQDAFGRYQEERLALMIFDAVHHAGKAPASRVPYATAALVGGGMVLVLIFLLPTISRNIIRDQPIRPAAPPRAFQGHDAHGRPIMENNQPVLFELMDGVYQQFDDDGRLRYELFYRSGDLISRKEYGQDGRLLRERFFKKKSQ